jgi:hypothetical protein
MVWNCDNFQNENTKFVHFQKNYLFKIDYKKTYDILGHL